MPENMLVKLTSPTWLKEFVSSRARILVSSINFTPEVVEREVAGEKHKMYIGSAIGKSWYGGRSAAAYEMAFIKKNHMVSPGGVVIECGAHHGASMILLSRWVGSTGKVIVVEPMPENIAILKKNIAINGLTNVTVVEKAAGASCGQLSMRLNSNAAVSSNSNAKNTLQVEGTTLDKIAEDFRVVPTLIKIDAEGYEYQILEGCKSILSTNPAVLVEVHTMSLPRYGKRFEDLWKLIDYSPYDIYIESGDLEEPKPFSRDLVPTGRVHLFFKPRQA